MSFWWGDEAGTPGWPFDDPTTVRFAVLLARSETVVGLIQYSEETEPMYRHASIDVFIDPAFHRRGMGRQAVSALADHLFTALGHHRLVIDPAAENGAAIGCYRAVGFQPVGVMRRYERKPDGSGWRDGLLMDLLADELAADSSGGRS